MGHVAAAAAIGGTVLSGYSAYRTGKAQQKMANQQADSARQLGEYQAENVINQSSGKVNNLNAQANISESNKNFFLNQNSFKYDQKYDEIENALADLTLKIGSNYSSYDYMKAVEKESFDKLTEFDYDISQKTRQSFVEQNEFARKANYQYALGLANADMAKYNANLQARGYRFKGEMAAAQGHNAMVGSLFQAAGQYATAGTNDSFKGKGIF
tara:strand:- start:7330 stop:7968 length:639 start_codon:yes stop_codon:yes gene_type:complete